MYYLKVNCDKRYTIHTNKTTKKILREKHLGFSGDKIES